MGAKAEGPADKGGLKGGKAPEFEVWNQGVHAKAGVTPFCFVRADWPHMPYQRVGGR